ncbi:hypothetical protein FHT36_003143 [Xanthobacter sp. SG618]|nr:hypothetical protein [Xanthobacter sp. SG618]
MDDIRNSRPAHLRLITSPFPARGEGSDVAPLSEPV